MTHKSYSSGFGSVPNPTPEDNMSNKKNNINILKDEGLKKLMYWTAKAQVGIGDVSVNLAKKNLLNDLLLDVKKTSVDEASLVKIKIWLESHKKQLEVE